MSTLTMPAERTYAGTCLSLAELDATPRARGEAILAGTIVMLREQ